CGYNFGDYFAHWLSLDKAGANLPKIFHVNWFRKGSDGKFLWPGFGDNLRVLEWIIRRCEGKAAAVDTPIGHVPGKADVNLDGLNLNDYALTQLLHIDESGWSREFEAISDYLEEYGPRTPAALKAEAKRIANLLNAVEEKVA
ncbi:MAG: phosphoenolpyruvate carboxykinase (GTP), partial [Anaerolineae bacterium]|nr:phosphoenolpyruvate carboxykinase (GTP) [Phycisphaerae bacterium]